MTTTISADFSCLFFSFLFDFSRVPFQLSMKEQKSTNTCWHYWLTSSFVAKSKPTSCFPVLLAIQESIKISSNSLSVENKKYKGSLISPIFGTWKNHTMWRSWVHVQILSELYIQTTYNLHISVCQSQFNTSYVTDSYIAFTLKMESETKNTIFALKMMVKSGLEKFILKSLHARR